MSGRKIAERNLRIIVTGGRRYPDVEMVFRALDHLHATRGISALAHGATPTGKGADWHADAWAKARGVPVIPYRAVPEVDGPWPAAGPRRNQRMLDDFQPDGGVAFPGDRGTRDMTTRMRLAGLKVWEPVKSRPR